MKARLADMEKEAAKLKELQVGWGLGARCRPAIWCFMRCAGLASTERGAMP